MRKYDFGLREDLSKHNEAPIIAALKQVEAGLMAEDVDRNCGLSKHTIYLWRANFGVTDASEGSESETSPL